MGEQKTEGSLAYVGLLTTVAALGGLLFGYDTAVIAGAIGFLQTHFGLDPQLWTGWAAASALVGCAGGAALAGLLSDRIGRRTVLVLAALAFLTSALGTAFPRGFTTFVVFRIIGGLGIGAASVVSPLYIAEIAPARIRGRLVAFNQFAIVSGIFVVYLINFGITWYGGALDQKTLAAAGSDPAARLERPFVESLVKTYAPWVAESEPAAVERLFADAAGPTSAQVAEWFRAHDVAVDRATVDLARQGRQSWNVEFGWRWMFGSGTLPALILLGLLMLVPESPRFLAEQERSAEALAVLARINGLEPARRELQDIEATIAAESGSFGQLFQPGMRRMLLIGVILAMLQQTTGINVILYYAPEIFRKMGAATDSAMLQAVLVGLVNIVFTVVAIRTVDVWGRKPLMLVGSGGMAAILLASGLASYYQRTDAWAVVLILAFIACFALSVGPVVWVILSEIFPTKIRGRAMAVATVALWLTNYVVTQTFTIMDGNAWLLKHFRHAFPFWVYAGLCLAMLFFVWAFIPETKGKSLEEIEREALGGKC